MSGTNNNFLSGFYCIWPKFEINPSWVAAAEEAQDEVDGAKGDEAVDGRDEAGDAEAVRVVEDGEVDVGGHSDQHRTDQEERHAEQLVPPQVGLHSLGGKCIKMSLPGKLILC